MRWDPPDNPNCNRYGVEFSSGGDSLLFFEPGH